MDSKGEYLNRQRDEAKAIANFLLMVSRTLRFMGSPSQTPRLGLCSHRWSWFATM